MRSIFLKTYILGLIIATGIIFSACNENIEIGKIDENKYATTDKPIGYILDGQGKRNVGFVELRNKSQVEVYLALTKAAKEDAVAAIKYDPAVLEAYNKANNTNYILLPQTLVTLGSDLKVAKESKKSEKLEITLTSNASLDANITYALPLSTQIKSGGIVMAEKESNFIILVKDLSKMPTSDKATGIKIVSCMEVNDTNPLNNLCFTLKKSGKPLFDQVILFSANINYNNETGRVYVYNNPNVQHLLDNREKYIKPLQDNGIKVILGILGNHDRSGVANLSDATARAFAQELKAVCDAYKLDGVFFDDEYSSYQMPPPPGFVNPSRQAAARLCYETKKAMPHKIVSVYVYSLTSSLPDVDGVQSGAFVDYALHDYNQGYDLSDSFPGMPKSAMGLYSQEYGRNNFAYDVNLRRLREEEYGAHMIFSLNPFRYNFKDAQLSSLRQVADILFDDELVYNEKPYAKDWK
ncbi:MAG: DUF1735 domain-containing protein [Bacteroidia bacterium]|nr:DUF1735 domain-containing protein [Bacteroidia bacterium]